MDASQALRLSVDQKYQWQKAWERLLDVKVNLEKLHSYRWLTSYYPRLAAQIYLRSSNPVWKWVSITKDYYANGQRKRSKSLWYHLIKDFLHIFGKKLNQMYSAMIFSVYGVRSKFRRFSTLLMVLFSDFTESTPKFSNTCSCCFLALFQQQRTPHSCCHGTLKVWGLWHSHLPLCWCCQNLRHFHRLPTKFKQLCSTS